VEELRRELFLAHHDRAVVGRDPDEFGNRLVVSVI
jgi:hypothetical protein